MVPGELSALPSSEKVFVDSNISETLFNFISESEVDECYKAIVGQQLKLKKGAVVVLESTIYPGVSEEIIAEGAARGSKNEFIQFLHISLGSLSELETQVIIANRLGYLTLTVRKVIFI